MSFVLELSKSTTFIRFFHAQIILSFWEILNYQNRTISIATKSDGDFENIDSEDYLNINEKKEEILDETSNKSWSGCVENRDNRIEKTNGEYEFNWLLMSREINLEHLSKLMTQKYDLVEYSTWELKSFHPRCQNLFQMSV